MSKELIPDLIDCLAAVVHDHAEELTALDQAIGDGDHGINMKRGLDAVVDQKDELAEMAFWPAVQKAGMTLVMKVGGASGPLYGSLLMSMGKAEGDGIARFAKGVEAVKSRGKSDVGAKTMLDVLVPAQKALEAGKSLSEIKTVAETAMKETEPMLAMKGRASFLGERSVGHIDPGARSAQLFIAAICDLLESRT